MVPPVWGWFRLPTGLPWVGGVGPEAERGCSVSWNGCLILYWIVDFVRVLSPVPSCPPFGFAFCSDIHGLLSRLEGFTQASEQIFV